MRGVMIESEVRHSARVHAGLLDSFIALTEAELARHANGFVEESLRELLETLRNERRAYGVIGGVAPVLMPVIENAA
ncbi:hypothetical protein HHL28_05240 [Aerophototrophica crusticola]|uniref:Uncharacterized protein n=1 Tax=Aerophototrophica crusticola TaxID=1709002 RepID=A0A858R5C3_9PROT|nr:hypothetical protein HHL28_05240 [Rhodospirillaceae bacterium B3]